MAVIKSALIMSKTLTVDLRIVVASLNASFMGHFASTEEKGR